MWTPIARKGDSYTVKLADAADPEAFKVALVRQTSGQLRVEVGDASEENRRTAGIIRPPLYGITGAILAIGVVSLLISPHVWGALNGIETLGS